MNNIRIDIRAEDILDLEIKDVLKEIEELLIKENQYLNQSKMKLLIKNIIGISNYVPGEYIEAYRGLMRKLKYAWMNLLITLLRHESLDLQIPPISGFSDEMKKFVVINENLSFKVKEDIEALKRDIRFKLIKGDTATNNLHIEFYEDRKQLYLNNDEKYKYLIECIDYINEIKNKEIFKHEDVLKSIAVFNAKMGDFITILSQSNIYALQIISIYANVAFLANNYLELKSQLIKEELQIIELGIKGEELVNTHLQMYDDEIINLSNIRLEVDGQSIENDNILITPYGIYVLEVKNLGSRGSYSLNISKDGKWTKKFKNGANEDIEYNATLQNERHIRYLQRYINEKLNRTIEDDNYIKVNGLVIISNNKVDIENNSEQPVFRISEIYRQITKNEVILTRKELLELKDIILSKNLEAKKYKSYDYMGELKDNFEVLNQQLDFYNISIVGLKIILMCFDELDKIIQNIKLFENKYNCRLIDKEEFFRNLDIRLIKNITKYLIKPCEEYNSSYLK